MATPSGFKRDLNLLDLTLIALGAVFGSGWLFAASHITAQAGPAGIFSWVIGGTAVLLLGLIYCELGAALPHAGAIIRYPIYTHGEILGYLTGFITLIAFSSIIGIEVVAAREYASAWFPWLTREGGGSPTLIGWLVQFLMLLFFFWVNYKGVKSFAKTNNIVSIFKFVVPFLVIAILLYYFKPQNLYEYGFATHGISGIEAGITAGGVMFAYLGLTPVISVASEVRNPQRTIPIALIVSVLISGFIYIALQLAFIGAVPGHILANGWDTVSGAFSLPFHDVALALGFGWLAVMVVCDAIVAPSGVGNIYMSATPRTVYAWARSGSFFKVFGTVDQESGVPRPALWLTFGFAVFWTLPFPSWDAMINVVSAALVMSYTQAPVIVATLRKTAPDLPRPFRVRGFSIMGPAAFIIAALIVYWSTWTTISWLLGGQIVLYIAYLCFWRKVPQRHGTIAEQLRSSAWLVGFYVVIVIISYLGSFGGRNILPDPWDSIVVALVSLVIYYWGANTGLSNFRIAEDEEGPVSA